jgi:hypothetical protein
MIPAAVSAPLVLIGPSDWIPLAPYTVSAPLVVIDPMDTIPLVTYIIPLVVMLPIVISPETDEDDGRFRTVP